MSHFLVLVAGPADTLEEQLAPYMENCCETPDKKYLTFTDTETEYREQWERNDKKKRIVMQHGTSHEIHASRFSRTVPFKFQGVPEDTKGKEEHEELLASCETLLKLFEEYDSKPDIEPPVSEDFPGLFSVSKSFIGYTLQSLPTGAHIKEMSLQEIYSDFETYVKDYHGDEERDDEKQRYGYWQNPNAKWDWYSIGGRWSGFFKLKEDATSPGKIGTSGIMTPLPEAGTCDQNVKDNIDFEGMLAEAREHADKVYSLYTSVIATTQPHSAWNDIRDWVTKNNRFADKPAAALLEEDYTQPTHSKPTFDFNMEPPTEFIMEDGTVITGDINVARALYHDQPRVKQQLEFRSKLFDKPAEERDEISEYLAMYNLDELDTTREDFVAKASENSIAPYAFVYQGEWISKGTMGWFGMSHDTEDQRVWGKKFNDMLKELPGYTTLTVVDCHI